MDPAADVHLRLRDGDVFFAIPTQPGQVTANDWSKYAHFTATDDIAPGAPVMGTHTRREEVRARVLARSGVSLEWEIKRIGVEAAGR